MRYTITDALGNVQSLYGKTFPEAAAQIERTGGRNVFGVESERRGSARFYLDRGKGPLYPISPAVANVELCMGGFA